MCRAHCSFDHFNKYELGTTRKWALHANMHFSYWPNWRDCFVVVWLWCKTSAWRIFNGIGRGDLLGVYEITSDFAQLQWFGVAFDLCAWRLCVFRFQYQSPGLHAHFLDLYRIWQREFWFGFNCDVFSLFFLHSLASSFVSSVSFLCSSLSLGLPATFLMNWHAIYAYIYQLVAWCSLT